MAGKEKQFVIRKYVMAKSAAEALKKEKRIPADDCWVSEEWLKSQEFVSKNVGFEGNKGR